MPSATIFSRFLAQLGVPHTQAWSDKKFNTMTFKSLYGFSHLLNEYKIKNEGVKFTDKSDLTKLSPPFLAQLNNGIFVIVDGIEPKKDQLTYDSVGKQQKMALNDFINSWNGFALLAFPSDESKEPEYGEHHLSDIISAMSKYVLALAAICVFAYFFISRGLYAHLSTILLTIFNCVGLYFSYLLVQKSLNIHSAASDRVCGVLEHGGCDSIMELKVSKLFGVFSWSEIGFGYFGISLITLLLFPHMWPFLAICNLCCLPYTVWSIWYQKFKAKHWCTLCVGVQTTLWLLFFCYLGGGWLEKSWPLHFNFLILIATYLFAILALNMLLSTFKKLPCHEKNS